MTDKYEEGWGAMGDDWGRQDAADRLAASTSALLRGLWRIHHEYGGHCRTCCIPGTANLESWPCPTMRLASANPMSDAEWRAKILASRMPANEKANWLHILGSGS